jgi:hypothetical protein
MFKKALPHLPVVIGLALLGGGLFYDTMFAGIPYQDPTPEMSARYARESEIASTIMTAGVWVFLFGLVVYVFRWLLRFSAKRRATS